MMTTQTPGASGPCCMGVGLGDSVPADFLFMKIGTFSGSPGNPGGGCFLLSLRAETRTKEVAAQSMSFLEGLRSLCADILQQKSGLSHLLLHTKKEGKDVPKGFPLGDP